MKKFSAILLAMIMLLSMAAMAADDGSITIENSTKDAIYTFYKVFDATYSDANVSYTYSGTLTEAMNASTCPFTFSEVAKDLYNVAKKDTARDADVITWISANAAAIGTSAGTVTGNGKEVTKRDLDYGYYFITTAIGSVVAIDSALKDVTVVDKTEDGPSIPFKTVNDANDAIEAGETATAGIGETVNYSVTGTLARYNGTTVISTYTFTDTMSAGLTYNGDLTITIDGNTLVKGTDYTITESNNGYVLTLTTWNDTNGFAYTVDAPYTIAYTATVNENAVIGGNGNTNKVALVYNNNPDTEQKDTTTTKVYEFSFDKVTTAGVTLDGAKFELAEAGTKIAFTVAAGSEGAADTYTVDPDGSVYTIEAGSVVIKGLDAGTYTLTETEAPAGYNKLAKPLEVVIAEDGIISVDGKTATGGNFDVTNNTGSELPSTGGIGTTIFYVGGGLLMLVAIVLLVAKKIVSSGK